MTKTEAKALLSGAFAGLSAKQRANLRWHASTRTPIACGKFAIRYHHRGGG